MTIQTETLDYKDGDTTLQAFIAWDDAVSGPRPGVLVSHAWGGRTDFENDKARKLAELGYAGFALDLYGKGITGDGPEENEKLMQPFLDDRAMLQRRMKVALETASGHELIDSGRVGAIGYCFGGLCVLDLARSGAPVSAVVSLHGLLGAPGNTVDEMTAKVLVLHGWDDPMAPPDHVVALGVELTEAKADWQIHAYGSTLHAFTNPEADDPDSGLAYDATADRRSWRAMQDFLAEALG